MSRENVEVVRKFLQAFNNGEYAACLETIDPDVEWHPPPDIPVATPARGRDALVANFRDWLGVWAHYRTSPEEVLEGAGNTVLVIALETAHGKSSGIEVHSRRVTQVYELRDGKIVWFKAYLDRGEALKAVGLRE